MPLTRRHALRRQALASLALLGLAGGPARGASRRAAAPTQVPARWAEAATLVHPAAVTLGGWLGARVDINASQRLLKVDTAPLLAGFQHKPGSHPWIGEHVGKWLHAATLAWAHSAEPALRARILQVSGDLIAAQEADGYLGTYLPAQRFGLYPGADWDVWSHKYCLIGLLTVYHYLGHAGALRACSRAADLLLARFGPGRSILGAGTHLGMAATSVLEPMVLLYRATGDARYLRFAQYLVRAWDEPGGPGIASALLQGSPVTKVANGKAYEMLSNLVGLCELIRATGQRRHLQAVLAAWQDIVDKRLYATGTTSQLEYFQPDHDLRDGVQDHVGETCVTTTWIQLNLALLQLTGQARFGDELERSLYNHLTAAQHPAGEDWCYFTALQGRKKYDAHITCCHSSGPRGLALAPQTAYLHGRETGHDVLLISSFEPSGATLVLGGQTVRVEQHSGFPYTGRTVLRLSLKRPARFAIKLRAPAWSLPMQATGATLRSGWAEWPLRTWNNGDELTVHFNLAARVMSGGATQAGRAALAWGPFVLAYEQPANPGLPGPHHLALAPGTSVQALPGPGLAFVTGVDLPGGGPAAADRRAARFLSFADAGAQGGRFQVWLHGPGTVLRPRAPSDSLLADGEESRSRAGNGRGSIIDGDFNQVANTWDGEAAAEDWFAVTLEEPAIASRFVFTHGRSDHDGGWFDTQAGKPRVQVQRSAGAAWETVGVLEGYPATTAQDVATLGDPRASRSFTLDLPAPVRFIAVRVVGKPASGDRPAQAFVSCAELQAFGP